MATNVEVERAKIKQMSRIEEKLEALKKSVDSLLERFPVEVVTGDVEKPKKVKSEK